MRWMNLASFILALALAILPYPIMAQATPDTPSPDVSHRAKILLKLKSIVIDKVDFNKADIATVLDFLSKKSKELDPDKEGINFVLRLPDDATTPTGTTTPHAKVHREVTLTLNDVPLADLLGYIAEMTNLQYSVEDYAVFFHPVN